MNLNQPARLEITIRDKDSGKELVISECFGVVNLERRIREPIYSDEIKPLYVLDNMVLKVECNVTGIAYIK